MHDAEYLRMLGPQPAYPASVALVKKQYEALEKELEESHGGLYHFTIRMRSDDRLIGFARLFWIEWSNGSGSVQLGIGDAADRRQGYGSETLRLLLRFVFSELNLYRLSATVPEYNAGAQRLFEKFGFQVEVRRRQALNRDGRHWDMLHYGILRDEWLNLPSTKEMIG
jgi:RimJ/RimL family protein N-acetyltransferase